MIRKILAATAALTLGLGGVLALAAPASATGGGQTEHVPVNVCHATSSDTNPYVFITVDDDSVKLKGHLKHRDDPNKTWKSDGVWNGVFHSAGDAKADRIESYTGTNGVYHKLDGTFSDCGSDTPKPNPVVDTDTDTRKSCEAGVEEQVTTTTTDWVFEDGKWVKGKPVVEVGDWTFVRDLTADERQYLECDPVVEPKPTVVMVDFFDPTCENTEAGLQVEYNPKQVEISVDPEGVPQPGDTITVTFTAKDGFYIEGQSVFEHTYGEVPGDCNQPPAKVTKVDDTRLACDTGLEARTYTTVTPYIWNGEKWVLDIDNAVTTHDDWTFVRDLNKGEKDELNCNPPKDNPPKDNPPKDNPPKPEPPAVELPHTGGNTTLLPWALGMLLAGVALTLLGYRRKSVA